MNKLYRVKKNEEIKRILDNRCVSSTPYLSLYTYKNLETNHIRYAISVSKKIGKAVIRNKIKRHITAVIDNSNLKIDSNIDFFIIVRGKILELDYQELYKNLNYLFRKQDLLKGENNE
ncbi:MAG: ribonuclease P protein component [Acholeplasmatales bacterium]|nr:ribonuclease P protein component [Acholeplasmatales bacterium]